MRLAPLVEFDPSLNLTIYRLGGNRLTAANWENNLSHAGSDYRYQNDTVVWAI